MNGQSRRTDRATAEIQAAAGRVEALVRLFPGEEFADVRAWLEATGRYVARLGEMVPDRELGEGRRQLGEQTRAWLVGQSPHMERNRGSW